jgi:hypothetical protein
MKDWLVFVSGRSRPQCLLGVEDLDLEPDETPREVVFDDDPQRWWRLSLQRLLLRSLRHSIGSHLEPTCWQESSPDGPANKLPAGNSEGESLRRYASVRQRTLCSNARYSCGPYLAIVCRASSTMISTVDKPCFLSTVRPDFFLFPGCCLLLTLKLSAICVKSSSFWRMAAWAERADFSFTIFFSLCAWIFGSEHSVVQHSHSRHQVWPLSRSDCGLCDGRLALWSCPEPCDSDPRFIRFVRGLAVVADGMGPRG